MKTSSSEYRRLLIRQRKAILKYKEVLGERVWLHQDELYIEKEMIDACKEFEEFQKAIKNKFPEDQRRKLRLIISR